MTASAARAELLNAVPSFGPRWSAAAAGKGVVSFARAGEKGAFWSAQVTRGVGPRLEIHLPSANALDDAQRASVTQTLNAHSRAVLLEGSRLRIPIRRDRAGLTAPITSRISAGAVTAERSDITVAPDRTSYPVKDMPAASGGSAVDMLDVLRSVPSVEVDGDN